MKKKANPSQKPEVSSLQNGIYNYGNDTADSTRCLCIYENNEGEIKLDYYTYSADTIPAAPRVNIIYMLCRIHPTARDSSRINLWGRPETTKIAQFNAFNLF